MKSAKWLLIFFHKVPTKVFVNICSDHNMYRGRGNMILLSLLTYTYITLYLANLKANSRIGLYMRIVNLV